MIHDLASNDVTLSTTSGVCVSSDDGRVECVRHCVVAGLTDCRCSGANSCLLCCRNGTSNGSCDPLVVGGATRPLTDSLPCENGMCVTVCVCVCLCVCV